MGFSRMTTLVFLSEFSGKNRIAHVFHDLDNQVYHVMCYENNDLKIKDIVRTENSAEVRAEDWVL